MFGFIVLFILIAGFLSCVKIVPQATEYVIEFLGSYHCTWSNGLHVKAPIIMRVARRVSTKEQVADFPPQPVITSDNVTMQIDTVVYYKVFNSKLFVYGVDNPITALANITATTLRNVIGGMELDQTLTSRDDINTQMQLTLDKATDAWGIKVNRVELKNIIPPKEIQNAMEKQMKAEREKRQTLLEAEAHKASAVTRAEGDKQALILQAEAERDAAIARATGEAESIRLVYEAEARGMAMLKEAGIDGNVLMIKKLDALKAVADGNSTKLVIPTDLALAASDLSLKSELLGIGDAKPAAVKTETKQAVISHQDDCCDDDRERTGVTKKLSGRMLTNQSGQFLERPDV